MARVVGAREAAKVAKARAAKARAEVERVVERAAAGAGASGDCARKRMCWQLHCHWGQALSLLCRVRTPWRESGMMISVARIAGV